MKFHLVFKRYHENFCSGWDTREVSHPLRSSPLRLCSGLQLDVLDYGALEGVFKKHT
jgi:hypothetical protein